MECWDKRGGTVHPRAKLTHKIAAAAKISARRQGTKKIKIFTKTWKTNKLQKTLKKSIKIDKNVDFGGATKKRTSPSNSTRKTTLIDLFSCPYFWKWPKTCYWTSANSVYDRKRMRRFCHFIFARVGTMSREAFSPWTGINSLFRSFRSCWCG